MTGKNPLDLFEGLIKSNDINDCLKEGYVVEISTEEAERLGFEDCNAIPLEKAIKNNLNSLKKNRKQK